MCPCSSTIFVCDSSLLDVFSRLELDIQRSSRVCSWCPRACTYVLFLLITHSSTGLCAHVSPRACAFWEFCSRWTFVVCFIRLKQHVWTCLFQVTLKRLFCLAWFCVLHLVFASCVAAICSRGSTYSWGSQGSIHHIRRHLALGHFVKVTM